MEYFIYCQQIYCEDGVKEGYLHVKNGKFGAVYKECPGNAPCLQYPEKKIIPGIFDTHNHGAMGYSVKEIYLGNAYEEEIAGYARALPAMGVTAIFPTTMEGYGHAEIASVMERNSKGAQIMGIHSEGPYLARAGEKGKATPPPSPSVAMIKQMLKEAKGQIKLVALAPEIPGMEPVIAYLQEQGVTVSIAHTNGDAALAKAAIAQGIHTATHLGNVMTGIHHRDVGTLGVCLLEENIDCEIICDGIHLCNDMLRLIFRLKDKDKLLMISDGTPYSGAPCGKYHGYKKGEIFEISENGSLTDENGKICGSTKGVLDGMKNLVQNLHMPLESVWPMASLNPARKYGFGKEKGSIISGKDADFVIIDDTFSVEATYVCGEEVYRKGQWQEVYHQAFLERSALPIKG